MSDSISSSKKPQIAFGTKSHVDTGQLLNRDGWMCTYCGRWLTLDDMTVDHIQPTLRGGPDTLDNTVVSCLACNAKKGDMNHLEFRHWLAVRYYAFVEAPNHSIEYTPIEIVIGKGRKQTNTIIALPALWAGVQKLHDEAIKAWEQSGAYMTILKRNGQQTDVAILGGVLYDYYRMKRGACA